MKRLLRVTAAAALAVAGLAAVPSNAGAAPAAPKINWAKCPGTFGSKYGAECGFLKVPLDHAHPKGATIKIAVSRIKHKTKKSQGIMLVNPGGPGGSGLTLPAFFTTPGVIPKQAAQAYD